MSANTIKYIAPYLDPHLLLFFLQTNTGKEATSKLQEQIKSKLLMSREAEAKKLEEHARQQASKILNLVNSPELKTLRDEHRFTLESLKAEKDIDINDCRYLLNYAKILYEQGEKKYKEAEKLLFHLKEILVNESQTNADLVLQVFWGLLACQIINGKGRDSLELTSLRKMRELIERKYGAEGIKQLGPSQEHLQTITWMLHWLLVYSFTSRDLTNTGLFATLLADHHQYGTHFLNAVEMRPEILSKYMITSFLLARGQPNEKYQINKDALEEIALPIVQQDSLDADQQSAFCDFLMAIYVDYDMDRALKLVEDMTAEANEDLFLHSYVLDIKKQAYLLIFEIKSKLFRKVEVAEVSKYLKPMVPIDDVCKELQRHFQEDGYDIKVDKAGDDGGSISCVVKSSMASEQKLQEQALQLFEKTKQLNRQYLDQREKVEKFQSSK